MPTNEYGQLHYLMGEALRKESENLFKPSEEREDKVNEINNMTLQQEQGD